MRKAAKGQRKVRSLKGGLEGWLAQQREDSPLPEGKDALASPELAPAFPEGDREIR